MRNEGVACERRPQELLELQQGQGQELGVDKQEREREEDNRPEGEGEKAPSFIHHKVSSKDTLAGIAIKYNVSVADIKRFNGLLSDTALYARDILLVPTKLYPVGEELQVIFAQVASGFGRDPILNADAHLSPASSAVTRVARTLHLDNASPFSLQGESSWCCECGGDAGDCERSGCPQPSSSRRSHFEPGEVELMERSPDGTMFLLPSTSGGGPTRLHDPVRRRRHGGTSSDDDGAARAHPSDSRTSNAQSSSSIRGPLMHPHAGALSNGGLPPRSPRRSSLGPGGHQPHHGVLNFKQLGKAIGESAWVQRIKAVANQPVLANSRMSSLSQTADGVLSSLKQGLQGGGAGEGASGPDSMRRSSSAQAHVGSLGSRGPTSSSSSQPDVRNSSYAPRHARFGSSGKAPDKSD